MGYVREIVGLIWFFIVLAAASYLSEIVIFWPDTYYTS